MGSHSKRGPYEIRYKPKNGSRGGFGPPKTFIATLSKGSKGEAQAKLRTPGLVIGVKRA